MSTFRVPQDVADRNTLRRLAQKVYVTKRDAEGKSATAAWAEVNDIVNRAVCAFAMEDMVREQAERIRVADAKRAADIERGKS